MRLFNWFYDLYEYNGDIGNNFYRINPDLIGEFVKRFNSKKEVVEYLNIIKLKKCNYITQPMQEMKEEYRELFKIQNPHLKFIEK